MLNKCAQSCQIDPKDEKYLCKMIWITDRY